MSAYHFRPLTCADLTMVARWLETPEVLRWWGDPKEQIVLITEDLDQPLMGNGSWSIKVAPSPTCRPIPQMPGRKGI
jgi:hypothetical protein